MRVLHFADCHIGLRQYPRMTKSGQNQREVDIGATFTRLITAAIEQRPDVIVIAGDVMHAAKPSNQAVVLAFREFSRLVRAVPTTPVLIAAGNHDLGKTADVGTILELFEGLGVHVATYAAKRFTFEALGLSVLCVPDIHGVNRPELTPDGNARYNVLCMHGEVAGVSQGGADRRVNRGEVSREELGGAWDYVALGHYHAHEVLAPNICYSGSPDFCSSNPWSEASTPKGFVIYDLEARSLDFHPIAPARPYLDLAPIVAQGMTAADVDAAIAATLASIPLDGAVVRLIVDGIDRLTEKALNQKALRSYALRAMHFRLDCRRPVAAIDTIRDVTTQRKREVESLCERVERVLGARELPLDVDRTELVAMALGYMDRAQDAKPDDAVPPEPQKIDPTIETPLERQLQRSIEQTSLTSLKRSA